MLNIGLLVLRVVVGLTIAAHGSQKLFGWFGGPRISGFAAMLGQLGIHPERPFAILAALAEFVGGVLVVLGLLTPITALVMGGSLVVAIFTVHLPKGFWNAAGGFEFPLSLLGAAVAIALTGPGRYSLDSLFGISLPQPVTFIVTAVLVAIGCAAALATTRLEARSRRPAVG